MGDDPHGIATHLQQTVGEELLDSDTPMALLMVRHTDGSHCVDAVKQLLQTERDRLTMRGDPDWPADADTGALFVSFTVVFYLASYRLGFGPRRSISTPNWNAARDGSRSTLIIGAWLPLSGMYRSLAWSTTLPGLSSVGFSPHSSTSSSRWRRRASDWPHAYARARFGGGELLAPGRPRPVPPTGFGWLPPLSAQSTLGRTTAPSGMRCGRSCFYLQETHRGTGWRDASFHSQVARGDSGFARRCGPARPPSGLVRLTRWRSWWRGLRRRRRPC